MLLNSTSAVDAVMSVLTISVLGPFRLLLVGGCESGDDSTSKASSCGITAWRTLSGSPHYKQVTSNEEDIGLVRRRNALARDSRQSLTHAGIYRHLSCLLESEKRLPQVAQLQIVFQTRR